MKKDLKNEQIDLFMSEPNSNNGNDEAEWGTFKDSLRAPIHGWFTYPAGFSYKAVESSFKKYALKPGQTVYDPFMGTGTTNVVAKKNALNSFGVEAHPFVFRIATTKLNWNVKRNEVFIALRTLEKRVCSLQKNTNGKRKRLADELPELVLKCFAEKTLYDLLLIRNEAQSGEFPRGVRGLLFVALTSLLRKVSSVHTGWPYIAPNKEKLSSVGKDALTEFIRIVTKMVTDIEVTVRGSHPSFQQSVHKIFNQDSRNTIGLIPSKFVDHVFTSPPYLNNFDYADRTRLELYFFREAKTWGDITEMVRTKLMTSATTQISRDDPRYELSNELREDTPGVFEYLVDAVDRLSKARLHKGGKKSYDRLVSGYFNDLHKILRDVFRVMKVGAAAVFVLGDSAPYGVHIPTDEFVGKIGVGVGFKRYELTILRARGGKWKNNPQRHGIPLRESIVTLFK